MNTRSTLLKIFIVLMLVVIVLMQLLSMKQSDRLFNRLNQIEQSLKPGKLPARDDVERTASENEGDWLVRCITAEPGILNPITSTDAFASMIMLGGNGYSTIFESMLRRDIDTAELVPFLAKSYEVSEDGKELIFELRDDIFFSDGEPVTAEDVVFTYNTIVNPGVDAAALASYFGDVEGCEKIDGRRVKFVMKEKYFKSAEMIGGMPIIPEHVYSFDDPNDFNKMRTNPVGSGPYVFEKWDVGREVVLRRNENYWGEKPYLKKMVFRVITNSTAALQALRSHDVDMLGVLPEQYSELIKDESFVKEFRPLMYWLPDSGYTYIGWNNESVFFNDKRVRLAMTHLIDRDSLNKHLMKGLWRVVTGPFYADGPQSNPDIEPWEFDPARAAELLDEAGWVDTNGNGIRDKDGVEFSFNFMIASGSEISNRIVKLLKDQMAKVGIELKIDPYEWTIFIQRLKDRKFEATTLAWTGQIESDPYQTWHSSQNQGGSNSISFNNEEADQIIVQARKTLDAEKRNKLYHRFHQILHEEQPYTFMFARPSLAFIDRRFENVEPRKYGMNLNEWYVPVEKQRYK